MEEMLNLLTCNVLQPCASKLQHKCIDGAN